VALATPPAPLAESGPRQKRILRLTILLSLISYAVVLFMGLYKTDHTMILCGGFGVVLLALPFCSLLAGRVSLTGIFIEVILLAELTALATFGNGIYDSAIMAFPLVIVFSGLAMRRSNFLISVCATVLALAWLVFGARYGLYVPTSTPTADWTDFVILLTIVLSTSFAVHLLAGSLRSSLQQTTDELEHRRSVEEQLRLCSLFDLMTGVHNRNYFEQELVRLEKSRLYPISVIVTDLDGLKGVNDTIGHQAGDDLLKQAALLLKSVFRVEDILARVGGDEFAALLPSTDADTARRIVERIHERIEEQLPESNPAPLRLSIGTATSESSDLLGAFTLADRRMYEDKAARRRKG
jgi:diguanylate cyclase (GGDEF)-like protein